MDARTDMPADRSGIAFREPPRLPRIVVALLAPLGLIILAYAILWVTKGRFLKQPFERIATRVAERPVKVAGDFQLYLNPHVKFLAEGLSIGNPTWASRDQLLLAQRIETEIRTLPLIFGQRRLRYLTIDGADVDLEWNEARQNSWTFGPSTGRPLEIPEIATAAIRRTRIFYRDPRLDLEVRLRVGDVNAEGRQFQDRIAFAGNGRAHGAKFGLAGALLAPSQTLAGGDNHLDARIDIASSRIDVSGRLHGAFGLTGSDLKLRLRGTNIATPFRLLGVAAPESRHYDIAAKMTKADDAWTLTDINGRFGDSDLSGRLTIGSPLHRLTITGALSSRKLDILDVGPWLGVSPQAIDRQGGKAVVQEVNGHPRLLPDAPLAVESLKRFDARIRYSARTIRTRSVPIGDFKLGIDLKDRLLKLDPVGFDVSGGRMLAKFAIDTRRRPVVTDYDMQLTPVPLGNVLTSFDVTNNGTTLAMRGRLKLRGYGDTIRTSLGSSDGRIAIIFPRGTLWVRNVELAELDVANFLEAAISKKLKKPIVVRCGVAAFTVARGLAHSDPVFIDTERNVIRGSGGFSFRDESLALKMEADSKRFSLFSGQSPIRVNGYFAKPGVNPISGKLIGRVAASVGLGLVATPVAALIPFLDLGEQENTDCTPILNAAHAPAVERADKAAERRK